MGVCEFESPHNFENVPSKICRIGFGQGALRCKVQNLTDCTNRPLKYLAKYIIHVVHDQDVQQSMMASISPANEQDSCRTTCRTECTRSTLALASDRTPVVTAHVGAVGYYKLLTCSGLWQLLGDFRYIIRYTHPR